MNKLKNWLIPALCFLGVTTAKAEENSLLWSVSGNGLEYTSYIFGTIHMMCESDFEVKEKVKSAFESCQQVFLEIDMDDPKELKKMMDAAKGDQKLSDLLTDVQQKRLNEKLISELGVPLEVLDEYSLNTISSMLLMNSLGCENVKSFEQEFVTMAREKEIEVLGLEKAAFQMKCLNEASDLETTFESIFEEDIMLDSLVSAYKREDMKAMKEQFSDAEYMDENMRNWLLIKRNAKWVKRMPKIMRKKPTFFAVGSGHLLNDYGILSLLRNEGYTVTPIFE